MCKMRIADRLKSPQWLQDACTCTVVSEVNKKKYLEFAKWIWADYDTFYHMLFREYHLAGVWRKVGVREQKMAPWERSHLFQSLSIFPGKHKSFIKLITYFHDKLNIMLSNHWKSIIKFVISVLLTSFALYLL